jgi:hypothetical protein
MADVTTEATSQSPVVPPNGAVPPEATAPEQTQDPAVLETPAEQAAPPPPAAPPPKDRMAERFAMLAKRERSVVERQQAMQRELAAREAQIAAHERELAAERSRYQETTRLIEAAKTDPKAFLRSLYGDNYYDHITKLQLADDGAPPPAELQVQAVRDELAKTTEQLRRQQAEINEKIEAQRKAAVEAEKARLMTEMNEEIQHFESEAIDFVKKNASKYELTNLYEQAALVPQVVQAAYEQSKANGTARLPSIEEAADLVESYLADEIAKAEQLKQRKVKPAQTAEQPTGQSTPAAPSPTLTNAMSGVPAAPSNNPLDEDQRVARALAVWDSFDKK